MQVRILCSKALPVDFDTGVVFTEKKEEVKNGGNIFTNFFKIDKKRHMHKAVILHVHGGGFVSMSSASHQTYTRVWANEVGVPIFSVDYRLAPAEAFPAALNDVWQVYHWIVENAETYLGIKPEKIILVGDSAGGNLITATTLMAIKRGYRVPDGLIMCYPALSLSKEIFTPSMLLAVDDPILPYPFLKMCIDSYIGDFKEQRDCDPSSQYYLSPGIAPDELLKKFPKTRIMVASNDPLRDESIKITHRLAKVGVDVYLKEYMYLPHGYLNYNAPLLGMKDESNETIAQCGRWLQDFLLNDPEDLI